MATGRVRAQRPPTYANHRWSAGDGSCTTHQGLNQTKRTVITVMTSELTGIADSPPAQTDDDSLLPRMERTQMPDGPRPPH